jgi:hypothetical protein
LGRSRRVPKQELIAGGFGPRPPTSNKEHTMTPEEYKAVVYAAAIEGAYCLAAMIGAGAAVWAVAVMVMA